METVWKQSEGGPFLSDLTLTGPLRTLFPSFSVTSTLLWGAGKHTESKQPSGFPRNLGSYWTHLHLLQMDFMSIKNSACGLVVSALKADVCTRDQR